MSSNYLNRSRKAYEKKSTNYESTLDWKVTAKLKEQLIDCIELSSGSRVLDVACGIGDLLEQLLKKNDIVVEGIDLSPGMIEQAKKRVPKGRFRVTDGQRIPVEDDQFDVVTVSAAFHHFPNPEQMLTEIYRVLKPQGKLYIADFTYPALIRQGINSLLPLLNSGDVRMYNQKEIVTMLEEQGYKDVEFERCGVRYIASGKKEVGSK